MGASSAEVTKVSVSIAKYVDRKSWCCGDCRLSTAITILSLAKEGPIKWSWSVRTAEFAELKKCDNYEAIRNAVGLYEPISGTYISIWLQFIDCHTNFYVKRCLTPRISCRIRKLVPQFSTTARYTIKLKN